MAISPVVSPKELERQAQLALEGRTLYVMLCNPSVTGLGPETPVSTWQTHEISGGGYSRFSAVIQPGTYSTISGSYEFPEIVAEFSATGGLSFTNVILYIDNSTYPHTVGTENPNIVLLPGQTQTYKINLRYND